MDRADRAEDDGNSPPSNESSSGGGSALRKALRDIAPYLDLGWRLAGTASFPPLLGFGLDFWLHTTPWMLLGGCVVGLSGAVLQLKRLQNELGS